MKQLTVNHAGEEWYVIMTVDGHGVCDTTIYRVRKTKRWWQSHHLFFADFVACPESMEEQMENIRTVIDKKLMEEKTRNNFLTEYHKLEDVPYI